METWRSRVGPDRSCYSGAEFLCSVLRRKAISLTHTPHSDVPSPPLESMYPSNIPAFQVPSLCILTSIQPLCFQVLIVHLLFAEWIIDVAGSMAL